MGVVAVVTRVAATELSHCTFMSLWGLTMPIDIFENYLLAADVASSPYEGVAGCAWQFGGHTDNLKPGPARLSEQ